MKTPVLLISALLLSSPAIWSAPVTSALFVGDSITKHGPATNLGWSGDWGMAATSADNDYVHLLIAQVAKAQGFQPTYVVNAVGGGTLAGKLADAPHIREQAKQSDLVIIQMGENDRDISVDGFAKPYEQLVRLVRDANPSARIICTGTWAPPSGSPVKDKYIRDVCARLRIAYADLTEANRDRANQAAATGLWTNNGVNWHPSDAGMAAYATSLFKALQAGDAAIPSTSNASTPSDGFTTGEILLNEDFENSGSPTAWRLQSAQVKSGPDGKHLEIENPDPTGAAYCNLKLDAALYTGRRVTVSATIGGAGISAPPKPYNGIKLMLKAKNAEGKSDYPQAPAAFTGTFPPREMQFTYLVPDNTVDLDLTLGLERSTGTLTVDNVRIVTVR